MDLHREGERIATLAIKAADGLIARYHLLPDAQADLLEILVEAIIAHREQLIEAHKLPELPDADDDV